MKVRLMRAEFFYVDRQTDGQIEMTNLTVAVRDFRHLLRCG